MQIGGSDFILKTPFRSSFEAASFIVRFLAVAVPWGLIETYSMPLTEMRALPDDFFDYPPTDFFFHFQPPKNEDDLSNMIQVIIRETPFSDIEVTVVRQPTADARSTDDTTRSWVVGQFEK